jgi:hypothetical protein
MRYFDDALPLTSAFLQANPHVGAASREVGTHGSDTNPKPNPKPNARPNPRLNPDPNPYPNDLIMTLALTLTIS